jgi:hypothetical protein
MYVDLQHDRILGLGLGLQPILPNVLSQPELPFPVLLG